MTSVASKNIEGLAYFNNIRYLMILLVVALHSAGAYNTVTPWWPVRDSISAMSMDIIYLLLLSFLMPIVFFIAGYFAPLSLERRGPWKFILRKARLLGVPFLMGVLFIAPLLVYAGVYTKALASGDLPPSYISFWLSFVIDFLSFHTGFIVLGKFNQVHFWFLPQLFFLFVGYAVIMYLKTRMVDERREKVLPDSPSAPSTIYLLIFAIVTWVLYSAVNAIISDVNWLIILNLLQSRPASYTLYICYFTLGVYAFRSSWYINGRIPRHYLFWIIGCISSSLAYVIVARQYWNASEPTVVLEVSFTFLRTFSCLTFLVVITSTASKWWRHISVMDKKLSDSSLMIYVIHFPIVLILQLFLVGFGLPIAIKYVTVTILSTLISFVVSYHVVRPRPWLAAIGLIIGNVILLILVHPS